jgi:hypothetical protein
MQMRGNDVVSESEVGAHVVATMSQIWRMCWAFSTTGSIEARTAIKNGQTDGDIVALSEQQLVSMPSLTALTLHRSTPEFAHRLLRLARQATAG